MPTSTNYITVLSLLFFHTSADISRYDIRCEYLEQV
jgi:hypothetical protein